MRRREFLSTFGSATAWPLACRAQRSDRVRRIAWLGLGRAGQASPYVDALRRGLGELGWVEGHNLEISLFWAGRDDMDAVARELVSSNPEVIVTQELMVYAVNRQKPRSPIVFGFSGDPVDAKLVQSFARPGSNLTGMTYLALALVGKRIELLKELAPQIRRIAILARPQHAGEQGERQASEDAAQKLGIQVSYFPVPFVPTRDLPQLDLILRSIVEGGCEALVVFPDAGMFDVSDRIARFAAEAKLPSVSGWAPFAQNGLLLSYGPSIRDLYRSLGRYVDRILKGANAGDLPVEIPDKIELVINLRTAKTLALTVPAAFLLRANEVIE